MGKTGKKGKQNAWLALAICLLAILAFAVNALVLGGGNISSTFIHRHAVLGWTADNAAGVSLDRNGAFVSTNPDAFFEIKNVNGYVQDLTVDLLQPLQEDDHVTVFVSEDGDNYISAFQNTIPAGEQRALFHISKHVASLLIKPSDAEGRSFAGLSVYTSPVWQSEDYFPVFIMRSVLIVILGTVIFLHIRFGWAGTFHFVIRHRYAFGLFFIAASVILNLNGSSLACWSMENLKTGGIVFGTPKTIRSDEWSVFTPMIFSQSGAEAYQAESTVLRAAPTDVTMVYALPCWSLSTLFRPFLWGFMLFGNARGLAFFWSARLVFVWLASYELFMLITEKKEALSACAAFFISFSPILAWWFAINGLAEMLIFGSYFVVLWALFFRSERFWVRTGALAGMVWCGGGYIMTIYPSWMVPLAYVYLVLLIWITVKERGMRKMHFRDRAGIFAAAVILVLLVIAVFMSSIDTVMLEQNTVYPGKRSETGGGMDYLLWTYPFTSAFCAAPEKFSTNECATMYTFFPAGIILSAMALRKNKKNLLIWLSYAGLAFLMIYCYIGFPEFLAKATLLSHSQAARAHIGVDYFNVILLFAGLSGLCAGEKGKENGAKRSRRRIAVRIAATAACALLVSTCIVNIAVSRNYMLRDNPFSAGALRTSIAFSAAGFFALLNLRYFKKWTYLIVGLVVCAAGAQVNPIQIGTAGLFENDIMQDIDGIVSEDADAVWIVGNGITFPGMNLTIMEGAHTINSTNVYPNLDLWERIDDSEAAQQVYNRYAHIQIVIDPSQPSDDSRFYLYQDDFFRVTLNNSDVRALGIDYVLTTEDLSGLSDKNVKYELVGEDDGYRIFRIETA